MASITFENMKWCLIGQSIREDLNKDLVIFGQEDLQFHNDSYDSFVPPTISPVHESTFLARTLSFHANEKTSLYVNWSFAGWDPVDNYLLVFPGVLITLRPTDEYPIFLKGYCKFTTTDSKFERFNPSYLFSMD